MSEQKYPCLFDNSKECPARKAMDGVQEPARSAVSETLEKACPICPIRLKMLKDLTGTLVGTR